MARIDDYVAARKLAAEKLAETLPGDISTRSGFELMGENAFRVLFIGRTYRVSYPEFEFTAEGEGEEYDVPLQEQVLILHYMCASGEEPTGEFVAYREIPGAGFYFSAFVKRAIDPLKKTFGADVSGMKAVAAKLGGKAIDAGDAGYEFQVFPKVAVQLILWEGDEEFSPEANILFDETIGFRLSPEDIAWLAGMLVYRLMGMGKE